MTLNVLHLLTLLAVAINGSRHDPLFVGGQQTADALLRRQSGSSLEKGLQRAERVLDAATPAPKASAVPMVWGDNSFSNVFNAKTEEQAQQEVDTIVMKWMSLDPGGVQARNAMLQPQYKWACPQGHNGTMPWRLLGHPRPKATVPQAELLPYAPGAGPNAAKAEAGAKTEPLHVLIFHLSEAHHAAFRAQARSAYAPFIAAAAAKEGVLFQLAWALGYPDPEGLPMTQGLNSTKLQQAFSMYLSLVCREQAAYGDLMMIDMRENLAKGKVYYTLKYIVEAVLPKYKYRYIIKTDEDTYIQLRNLASWMTKERHFQAERVYFGGCCCVGYYPGAMYGMSAELATQLARNVREEYMGGDYEDATTGVWVSLFGGGNITNIQLRRDLAMLSVGCGQDTYQCMQAILEYIRQEYRFVFVHHIKNPHAWLHVADVVASGMSADL